MDSNVGRIGALLGFIALFVLAVAMYLLLAENNIDTKISDETVAFVNSCASNGKIDPTEYYGYATRIATLGNYSIEMEHKSKNYYPDANGGFKEDFMGYYEKEITTYMFPNQGDNVAWEMKSGDFFTVTVKKNASNFARLFNAIFQSSSKTIIVDYSMMVGEG